jgi:hypothetical protein
LPKPDRKKHCTGNDHHNHDYPADDHNSPTNYNNDDDHDSPTDNNNDHDCSTNDDDDDHDHDDDSSTDYDYHDYNDDDSSTDYDYDICSRNYNSECTIWGVGNSWKLTGFAYLDSTNFEWWIVDYRLRDRI